VTDDAEIGAEADLRTNEESSWTRIQARVETDRAEEAKPQDGVAGMRQDRTG
jgi:hypothetical protein